MSLTPEVPSLPRTPIQLELSSSTPTSGYTDMPVATLANENCETEITIPIVEAYNYNITDMCQPSVNNEVLKDSGSFVNEHKLQEVSNINAVQDIQPVNNDTMTSANEINYINDNIILEDLPDDGSDTEVHASNCISTLDENNSDFFTIQTIKSNTNLSPVEEVETCVKDENITELIDPPMCITENVIAPIDSDLDFVADFSAFSLNEDNSKNIPETNNNDVIKTIEETVNDDDNEEDFDDFHDFESNTTTAQTQSEEQKIDMAVKSNENEEVADEDEDDDDFGDFTVATAAESEVEESSSQQHDQLGLTVNLTNLHERVKSILCAMFPLQNESEHESEVIQPLEKMVHSGLELPMIDSAKALDFQWAESEMRHSFIKSVGIDSRNILYGDNWNSSVPRFAANLTSNPLQPLKPQSDSQTAAANKTEESVNKVKSNDVPAVDFDWNSSGLVNPLDASQVNTLLLDVDQLVKVANVDNINLDCSSYCSYSSPCATTTTDDNMEMATSNTVEINLLALDDDMTNKNFITNINAPTTTTTTNLNINHYNQNQNQNHNKHQYHSLGNTPNQTNMLDCRSKEIIQTRDTETLQPRPADSEPTKHDNEPQQQEQQQQQQQQSKMESSEINTTSLQEFSIDSNNATINVDNDDKATFNSTTIVATTTFATTTTTLSSIVSTDSLSDIPYSYDSNNTKCEKQNSTVELEFPVKKMTNMDWLTPHPDHNEEHDEVVTTSTYAGPLKETHIYTPPRDADSAPTRTVRAGYISTPNTPITSNMSNNLGARISPIDFDFEKAAAGIIIDEKVVKKEYRDVEYNPGFDYNTNKTLQTNVLTTVGNNDDAKTNLSMETDDEFTEFQSVPPISMPSQCFAFNTNSPVFQVKQQSANRSHTTTPLFDEMILSPAILLPQAISLENNNNNNKVNNNIKTQIEWGEKANAINPDELARIEELYSQPKTNVSHKSTPIHVNSVISSPLTISAAIAQKEQQAGGDDDDWSEFISVPISNTNKQNEKREKEQSKSIISNTNDDEWSDFISSSPQPNQNINMHSNGIMNMQFNSGAWQNANYYNNPLSYYRQQTQAMTSIPQRMQKHKSNDNNNNNNHNNSAYNTMQTSQNIHVMQDFSLASANVQQQQHQQYLPQSNNSSQFQIGSAKVAPSISLIPDLGFVAPAIPTHTTTLVNVLPKTNFNVKK